MWKQTPERDSKFGCDDEMIHRTYNYKSSNRFNTIEPANQLMKRERRDLITHPYAYQARHAREI